MRMSMVLRAVALAAALSAPLAQAALAGQQQAMVSHSTVAASSFGTGPYDVPTPTVGD
ncbi:MAG: hypothetical protein ACREED_07550 [Stellaceae bacterium]